MSARHRLRRCRSLSGRRARGMTLLEVLISVGILALVATLIYGAFDGMQRSRASLSTVDERYHQGRQALSRISRELESAFLSLHMPPIVTNSLHTTVFVGTDSNPYDRIDFCSFSHRRLGRDAHESDQNELSYFASRDPDRPDKTDLGRREQKEIDNDPQHGGVVNVAAEDIESFDLTYLDPITGEWLPQWDSTQLTAQMNRLPLQVKVALVLKGGPGGKPIPMATKAPVSILTAISFGIPRSTQ
ncbi:MAG TPA: prepilin-type N-terminal cleavage/methylation domain-containing protein [Minicystis sp.]|nr:prepilin-type N-terminal cleavage/methylation domain-containing protein [Minicystis sp.]